MPLEETAWDILSIAAIAQRQGDDLTWLTPYWPVMETWWNFMKNLLPFPQLQVRAPCCADSPPVNRLPPWPSHPVNVSTPPC